MIACPRCPTELQPSSYPIGEQAPERRTLLWAVYAHLRVVHRFHHEAAQELARVTTS